MTYLSCIRRVKGVNENECRLLAKSYLACRMDRWVILRGFPAYGVTGILITAAIQATSWQGTTSGTWGLRKRRRRSRAIAVGRGPKESSVGDIRRAWESRPFRHPLTLGLEGHSKFQRLRLLSGNQPLCRWEARRCLVLVDLTSLRWGGCCHRNRAVGQRPARGRYDRRRGSRSRLVCREVPLFTSHSGRRIRRDTWTTTSTIISV